MFIFFILYPSNFNGGEGGIRTHDWVLQYTISSRAPSASSDTSPNFLREINIINEFFFERTINLYFKVLEKNKIACNINKLKDINMIDKKTLAF